MTSKTWHRVLLGPVVAMAAAFGAVQSSAQTAQELAIWLNHYTTRDVRADYNKDGVITPADFTAFLYYHQTKLDTGSQGDTTGGEDGGTDDESLLGGSTSDVDPDRPDGKVDGGEPTNVEGWTDIVPSADTRKIYVAVTGSDSNDGRSPSRPLRTVAAGIEKLRDGHPDWLLLRRGDTFAESLGSWSKSGRSVTEPMVISSYGEGPRPRLYTGDSAGLSIINDEVREHLAFIGLQFQPGAKWQKSGIQIVGANISDILIEDCMLTSYQVGIIVQGFGGRISDVRLRRNVIVDSGGSTHSQGVFSSNTDGLLIEENFFDRNGWRADLGRDATAGIFAHNLYIQRTNTDVVFRNNWTSRAAAEGYKSRSGGVVNGNIFLENPIAVSFGNDGSNDDDRAVTGTVNDNVVLESIDINSDYVRGWGIRIEHTASAEAKRNVVANAVSQWGFGIAGRSERTTGTLNNLAISDNVIHNHGTGIEIDETLVVNVGVSNNVLTSTIQDEALVDLRKGVNARLYLLNNKYMHTASGRPFEDGPDFMSFSEWRSSNETSATYVSVPWVSNAPSMDDYARSVGFSSTQAMYSAIRGMRRGAWDERLQPQNIRAYFANRYSVPGS